MIWYVVILMIALIISLFAFIYYKQGEHRRYDRRVFDRRVRDVYVGIDRRLNKGDRRQFNRRTLDGTL